MNDEDRHWHLDRKVPIAIILTILVQTAGVAWLLATINARVETLERRVEATAPQADRITRLEVRLDYIVEGIAEIKRLISRNN